VTRLYIGRDGQTRAEEIGAKFTAGGSNEVCKMMATTGAELHRSRARHGHRLAYRSALPIRDYSLGPGRIDLVEDTTGEGHITRVIGNEERVTLQIPLSDQSQSIVLRPA
jgi:hypothetical protein